MVRCNLNETNEGSEHKKARALFYQLWERIARSENFVPRNHSTIGGFWTVDRYRLGTTEALLMDEGWTQEIRAIGLRVTLSGSDTNPRFHEGNEALLAEQLAISS
jgi:hypothetical protein